ncbi:unnamed protein product [Rotaria sp. Silwood1]|nr:unnamed protein product [Rotaria sp. Silwood1]CAF0741527.1 unnamed protein product [Rotaria sp. Silwood1]CAF0796941.1 unnamed protein product [Rotaria sp. Silwood1]CAF3333889.1 unnamed protein product [Rotaria sp. Silwood1]CAF3345991.1 unnamed protein product [Rotaria sp. Silwood1]
MQRTPVIQPTTTVDKLIQDEDNANETVIWNVFRKMLFFTVMMTLAPITSFFLTKDYIFAGILNITDTSSYIYSAAVAVIVVHIILIAFLYVAFRDDRSGKKTKIELMKESTGKKD